MSSALVYLVAGLIVALGGGLLVVGMPPPDEPLPPAALATASAVVSAAATATSEPSAPTPAMTSEPSPWPSPTLAMESEPGRPVFWETPSVIFEADALRIRLGGEAYTGDDPRAEPKAASHVGENVYDFDLDWVEDGTEVSLSITLVSDGTDYWVDRFTTWADPDPDEPDVFPGTVRQQTWGHRLFVTPLGQPMEADVRLTRRDGKNKDALVIDGMRLTAFHPGSGPGPLTGCQPPEPLSRATRKALVRERLAMLGEPPEGMPDRVQWRMLEPLIASAVEPPRAASDSGLMPGEALLDGWDEPDHPFAGTGIWTMSPSEVESLMREAGVCFEFAYTHPTGVPEDGDPLTIERWCVAPPDGEVTGLTYARDRVIVSLWGGLVRPEGDVPPQGWGCPTL